LTIIHPSSPFSPWWRWWRGKRALERKLIRLVELRHASDAELHHSDAELQFGSATQLSTVHSAN
jgi:hypothetical protein